jgi:2-dehydro-3-deoxyphosphooctonate aldolase (KDO 8-P synthase)
MVKIINLMRFNNDIHKNSSDDLLKQSPIKFVFLPKTYSMDLNLIPQIKHTNSGNFFLLAGPCAIEGEEMAMRIAEHLVKVTDKLQIPFIFKGSFKKANRSRIDSFTGIGDEKALKILRKVSETFKVPTVTDIHEVQDAAMAAAYVDVLQIPAFLVRQTDLVMAAAKTGKVVNLKKGQFMSPGAMKHSVQKVLDCGNSQVTITDRGTMFGYQDMIVDFRGIPEMQQFAPTILDVTHSLQQPNQESGVTGGKPALIETIARAGIAVGVDGIFIETHFDPANAKSDGANMLHLDHFEKLMTNLVALRKVVNTFK